MGRKVSERWKKVNRVWGGSRRDKKFEQKEEE